MLYLHYLILMGMDEQECAVFQAHAEALARAAVANSACLPREQCLTLERIFQPVCDHPSSFTTPWQQGNRIPWLAGKRNRVAQ